MTQASQIRCSSCGTLNRAGRDIRADDRSARHACWLCHTPIDPASDQVIEYPAGAEPAPGGDLPRRSAWDATLVLIVTAMAVACLGAFLIQPGIGILLAIASIIPIVRTTMVVSRRAAPTSWSSAILLFLSSMVVTWIIIPVVAAAAVGTFCLTCLGTYSGGAEEMSYWLAGGATLAVVIGLSFAFRKWIKARWRRDVSEGG